MSALPVIFSQKARDDLDKIKKYISTDSPRRAVSFVNELIEAALKIADAPDGFVLIPRYEHMGIRRKPYRSYLIFYQLEIDHVGIVHVLHSAQDYEAILFPDG